MGLFSFLGRVFNGDKTRTKDPKTTRNGVPSEPTTPTDPTNPTPTEPGDIEIIYGNWPDQLQKPYEKQAPAFKVVKNEEYPSRWVGRIQWQDALIPDIDATFRAVALNCTTTEADFWRVSTNNGYAVRLVLDIKFPDNTTKAEATKMTQAVYEEAVAKAKTTSFITVDRADEASQVSE